MTLQQTIKIPADRRVHLDLPRDIPAGVAKFKLIITPFRVPRTDAAPQTAEIELEAPLRPKKFDPVKAKAAHERMCGMFKTDGHEVDRFMAEKAAEKVFEL
jgi:hypothetical protein